MFIANLALVLNDVQLMVGEKVTIEIDNKMKIVEVDHTSNIVFSK